MQGTKWSGRRKINDVFLQKNDVPYNDIYSLCMDTSAKVDILAHKAAHGAYIHVYMW